MKEECLHQRETLEHGLYALVLAEGILERRGIAWGLLEGDLNSFLQHESREVNMFVEAEELLSAAEQANRKMLEGGDTEQEVRNLREATSTVRREFFRRAVDGLTQCECRG